MLSAVPTTTQQRIGIALLSALLALQLIRLAAAPSGWWRVDDPQILRQAAQTPPAALFLDPAAARELTPYHFTPWLPFSFQLDLRLAGLTPRFFYAHQFAALAGVFALAYLVFRCGLPPAASLFATLALALTRPAAEAAEYLMLRHYVEGLAFSLGAVLCLAAAPRPWSRPLAALLYAAACTAKELFVPLPLLLLFLPGQPFRTRRRETAPLFGIALVYAGWRLHMVGHLGGYGTPVEIAALLRLPLSLVEQVGLPTPAAALALGGLLWFAWRGTGPAGRRFLIAATLAGLLPLLPLAGSMAGRFATGAAVLLAALAGWALDRAGRIAAPARRRAAYVALVGLAVILPAADGFSPAAALRRAQGERARVEGRFALEQGTTEDVLLYPGEPPWFYQGLEWLREVRMGRAAGPRCLFDPIAWLERAPPPGTRYHRYDPAARALVLVPPAAVNAELAAERARLRPEAPLSVRVTRAGPRLEWALGPRADGQYGFIVEEQLHFPVARAGRRHIRDTDRFAFRIKYTAPEGWVTYSPTFTLTRGDPPVDWTR